MTRPKIHPRAVSFALDKMHFEANAQLSASFAMPGRAEKPWVPQLAAEIRFEWCEEAQQLLLIVDRGEIEIRVERSGLSLEDVKVVVAHDVAIEKDPE